MFRVRAAGAAPAVFGLGVGFVAVWACAILEVNIPFLLGR